MEMFYIYRALPVEIKSYDQMSRIMRKPTLRICDNKGANQLRTFLPLFSLQGS